MHNQPKPNKDNIKNLNRPIKSNETQYVIKSLSTKKIPGPDDFPDDFYENFKEELVQILL
jgi:hypothetical protein